MLIVSNGAFKSGSTWLTLIVRQMGEFLELPADFKNEAWKNNSIDPQRIPAFLERAHLESEDYLIKAHFKPEDGMRPILLADPNVRVLNIYRDPKDVLVSAYYHFGRIGNFKGTMDEFIAARGDNLVRSLTRYHLYWDSLGAEDAIFFTTYQKLHQHFDEEVFRLGRFFGWEMDSEKIRRVRENTEFSKLSGGPVPEEKRFFRKGVMGDWQRHLSTQQAERVDQIEREEGIYLVLDDILY
jgi:hypothetical protein